MNKSDFGVIGLGIMGKSISQNIANKGLSLSVYNRSEGEEAHVVAEFLKDESSGNVVGYTSLDTFVSSLTLPRKILMMIPAGEAIDQVIDQLIPLLDPGDILIDGGNSHFQDTKARLLALRNHNIHYIGAGISGGEEGALSGPSIMPGGAEKAYQIVAPILEKIAAKDHNHTPCCTYIGPEGAGHFVKMVHNGIEYAEMQLLAEIFAILAQSMNYEEIAKTLSNWNAGGLNNYLLEITIDILGKKENDQYLLDHILDQAGNKGTGSWSSKAAFDLGVANTLMSSAVFARYLSSYKTQRVKLSRMIEKHLEPDVAIDSTQLKKAYHFARLINHHQGFELIRQASETYHWQLNLPEIARIWTNGCIIKSTLMERLVDFLKTGTNLLFIKKINDDLQANEDDITEILKYGLDNRLVLPALSAARDYWVAMTTENLPANLIQAQRDFFGAHTYQRKDAPADQFFHTNWKG